MLDIGIISHMANRLSHELSPYLLAHAENPVNWQPWDAQALETAGREQKPDLSVDRLFGLPLVPRDGARQFSGRRDRPAAGGELRQHQGRPGRAAGPGPDLHGGRAVDDRPGRLADVGIPHARVEAVLRRHVLACAPAPGHAGLRRSSARRERCLAEPAQRRARSGPARHRGIAG